uniref:Calmodulin n=1 Tax=Pseudictyota dubia TaxID=2749911 RepID=A0A7R9ZD50_9STRA|mmetsp:Transcript_3805/g.6728  ORF Transcript_3805/g.6728 Transcript_3805/m.6728 type:complete len:127 (+) Transcript_3805:136-516(+)|eukprot:CAMPEP_0197438542 /NCGR_PEP_ID=MMETSP1175-20131217/5509_1 /TAXON_ID=1003142 /ORGANISM="Triceratium dubium, Strain CCMP147" /LENGTH=126 /DNA_ID=CAMNT_0042968293 /DNA_START=134 /DNA_END=514 /DNA_ORIENTATION=-
MALSLALTRTPLVVGKLAPAVPAVRAVSARFFSSQGLVALEKLKGVFEEYRVQNYSNCLPSRFKKDLVKAADKNNDGNIPVDGIERLLHNIGADGRISRTELEMILSEAGEPSNMTIPAANMIKLI